MKLYSLLIGLLLASKALGQDYYQKPKPHRLAVSVGINWQYLSPVFTWATRNIQSPGSNVQIGLSYNLPFRKTGAGFSISPEIALRTNNTELSYQTPIGDAFIRKVHGYSSQIFLPVKYRYKEFALSIGLFAELPISLQVKEDVNQKGTVDWLPNINKQVTQIGKGWQVTAEYNLKRVQLRLLVGNRSAISQDYIQLIPPSKLRGCTVGYWF